MGTELSTTRLIASIMQLKQNARLTEVNCAMKGISFYLPWADRN